MFKLNDKIKSLKPYNPTTGDYRIRLDANESFIETDSHMLKLLSSAAKQIQYNRYPDPLAARACGGFAGFYGLNSDCVTAGNGSDELISVIMGGFFCKGQRVLTVVPDFSMYAFYAHMAELDCISLQKSDGLELDADKIIAAALDNNVSGIIFSNPCNPTSQMSDSDKILRIADRLKDVLIIADEAYMDFAAGQTLMHKAQESQNLLVLKTCSKFGYAAIRLGFAVCGSRLTDALRAIKSPYNVNSFTDAAGALLFSDKEYLKSCINKIRAQRDKLLAELSQISGIEVNSANANFVFIRLPDAGQVYKKIAACGVAVRFFKELGALRVTAGSDAEQREFIKVFKECLN